LAAFAATASFAQTVQIVGGLDAGYALTNNKGASFQQVKSNNSYTSNVTFLVAEDLGGGLTANARWEIDIDPTLTAANTAGTPASPDNANAANYMGNGYSFVGLKSATNGEVQFGTLNTVTLDANGAGQPFGTAIGSGYKTIALGATRYQKAISYEAPTMNGFTARYTYVPKDQYQNNGATSAIPVSGSMATNGRDQINELGLKYLNGPLTMYYTNLQSKSYSAAGSASFTSCSVLSTAALASTLAPALQVDGGAGNACSDGNSYTVNTFAGNFVKGDWTGYAWYQTQKQDAQTTVNPLAWASNAPLATISRKAMGVAAKYQASPALTIQVGYRKIARNADESYNANATSTPVNAVATGIGQSTKLQAFGADYALSKRTSVYMRYETITDDALLYNMVGAGSGSGYTTGQGNGKITNTAFGIRATF
jgi:predicted porin